MEEPTRNLRGEWHRGARLVDYNRFTKQYFAVEEIKKLTGQDYDYGCFLDGLILLIAVERDSSRRIKKALLDVLNGPKIIFRSGPLSEDFADLGKYAEESEELTRHNYLLKN